MNCLRNENASSSAIPTNHSTADVHTKADKLQTMVVAFNVLFDVFKILSIELHRKKEMIFILCVLRVLKAGS